MKIGSELARLAGTESGEYKFQLSSTQEAHPAGVLCVYRRGGFILIGMIDGGGRVYPREKGAPERFETIQEAGEWFEARAGRKKKANNKDTKDTK